MMVIDALVMAHRYELADALGAPADTPWDTLLEMVRELAAEADERESRAVAEGERRIDALERQIEAMQRSDDLIEALGPVPMEPCS